MAEESKRILVVDDDELLLSFYSRVLDTKGYVAVGASNGDEAIDILDSEGTSIDLAIIDLLMPIRTGFEVIDHMRGEADLKHIPIIAITGFATSDDQVIKVKDNCDAIVLKSDFEIENFLDTVSNLLEKN
jgi:two-component system cell cycle response regulator DivK